MPQALQSAIYLRLKCFRILVGMIQHIVDQKNESTQGSVPYLMRMMWLISQVNMILHPLPFSLHAMQLSKNFEDKNVANPRPSVPSKLFSSKPLKYLAATLRLLIILKSHYLELRKGAARTGLRSLLAMVLLSLRMRDPYKNMNIQLQSELRLMNLNFHGLSQTSSTQLYFLHRLIVLLN